MVCCKICKSTSSLFAQGMILGKYNAEYYRCEYCGFIQTEEPRWNAEAYEKPINEYDTGIIRRNEQNSKIVKAVIRFHFDTSGKFVDYGGGYGLIVRMMRDKGFDFYWYDKYCVNIFSEKFNASDNGINSCELVTAFEVLEHLCDPTEEIEKMLSYSQNILFSTDLVPAHTPKPGAWWYYGLEHGQHISFYTMKSLLHIARTYHLNLYSDGKSYHLLTAKSIMPVMFKVAVHPVASAIINLLVKNKPKE